MNPTLLEWLCAREVCRRIGFTPDEIYFVYAYSADGTEIGLELRRGGKTFLWTMGLIEIPRSEMEAAFEKASTAWNAGEIGDETFFASAAFKQSVPLMLALQRKGFVITSRN